MIFLSCEIAGEIMSILKERVKKVRIGELEKEVSCIEIEREGARGMRIIIDKIEGENVIEKMEFVDEEGNKILVWEGSLELKDEGVLVNVLLMCV